MTNPLLLSQEKEDVLPIGFAIVMKEANDGERRVWIEDLGGDFALPNNEELYEMIASIVEELNEKED